MVLKKYLLGLSTGLIAPVLQSCNNNPNQTQEIQQTQRTQQTEFVTLKRSPYEIRMKQLNEVNNTEGLYELISGFEFQNPQEHNYNKFLEKTKLNPDDTITPKEAKEAYNKIITAKLTGDYHDAPLGAKLIPIRR